MPDTEPSDPELSEIDLFGENDMFEESPTHDDLFDDVDDVEITYDLVDLDA